MSKGAEGGAPAAMHRDHCELWRALARSSRSPRPPSMRHQQIQKHADEQQRLRIYLDDGLELADFLFSGALD